MSRAGVALIMTALLVAAGCWNDDSPQDLESTRPRGIQPIPVVEQAAEQAEEPEPSAEPAQRKLKRFDWDAYNEANEPPEPEEEKDEGEEEKRDYAADLEAAVGSPIGCLKPRSGKDVPPKINITLSAVVIETGRVTRGSASSAQLTAEESACITKRVESAIIPPNVEGAPRSITATVTLELKKPDAKSEPAAPR